MEGMIKVSIIIPIYNTGEKLYRCLDSVRNQTFANFECLMVDDGSKDESPKIIDQYSLNDERFKAIHKLNGGVSSARNLGLQNASGEWIAFLDSDDFLMKNHLEAMLVAASDDTDIVYTGFDQIATDKTIAKGHQYHSGRYIGIKEVANFLSKTDALQFMIPWDRMYRRSIIERESIRFDEKLSLSEDRLFCYHFLLHTLGVAAISEVTYRHDASDVNTLSFRFYPFCVNAYRHDVFVDVTGKLLARYPFSDHAIFLLWKYIWDILVLTLSSMYDVKKNIFIASNKQKSFFQQYFSRMLYDKVKETSEVLEFTDTKEFQTIFNGRFLSWNLRKAICFVLYKFHISR